MLDDFISVSQTILRLRGEWCVGLVADDAEAQWQDILAITYDVSKLVRSTNTAWLLRQARGELARRACLPARYLIDLNPIREAYNFGAG